MANEFFYCVSLSITHPTIDPTLITRALSGLRPKIQTMARSIRRDKSGNPLIPSRRAALSHWLAELHEGEKLYSGTNPISSFIIEQLSKLEQHRELFAQLREEGQVTLIVGWFSISSYSAELLTAEALRKCGDLGVNIEMNFYSP